MLSDQRTWSDSREQSHPTSKRRWWCPSQQTPTHPKLICTPNNPIVTKVKRKWKESVFFSKAQFFRIHVSVLGCVLDLLDFVCFLPNVFLLPLASLDALGSPRRFRQRRSQHTTRSQLHRAVGAPSQSKIATPPATTTAPTATTATATTTATTTTTTAATTTTTTATTATTAAATTTTTTRDLFRHAPCWWW